MSQQEAAKPVKKNPQTVRGVVLSDKMNKTCVIETRRRVKHKLYHKQITLRSKLKVHDEKNECKIGDTIVAEACRPRSKHKHFRLKSVVERAELT